MICSRGHGFRHGTQLMFRTRPDDNAAPEILDTLAGAVARLRKKIRYAKHHSAFPHTTGILLVAQQLGRQRGHGYAARRNGVQTATRNSMLLLE